MRTWRRTIKRLKNKTDHEKHLVTCLSISCLAAIIHVCVSGLLIAPASQVAGILVTGWLIGSLFKTEKASPPETVSAKFGARFLLLFSVVISLMVTSFATLEIGNLAYRTSYAQSYGPITPRFWQDGRFCEYSF